MGPVQVFPACAGMYRIKARIAAENLGVPRMRGDVPPVLDVVWVLLACSPHARGCTFSSNGYTSVPSVFPACAGMYRSGH